MKKHWELYQSLELIPKAVPCPKTPLFAWLTAPVQRSFADIFTRKLSHRHQVLLLKRCLGLVDFQQEDASHLVERQASDLRQGVEAPEAAQPLTPKQQTAQEWLNHDGLPWWT
jgi:hypothetical protein